MNRKELYSKTVDILVQAYFDDTLVISSCGCAVGNLIAASMNYKVVKLGDSAMWIDKDGGNIDPHWHEVFSTSVQMKGLFGPYLDAVTLNTKMYFGKAKREIESVGYTADELFQIEKAFSAGYCKGIRAKDRMYNGLMLVVDTLNEIHQNTNTSVSEITRNKFTEPQLIN